MRLDEALKQATPRKLLVKKAIHAEYMLPKLVEALAQDRPAPRFSDYTCRSHASDCPCCEWRKKRDKLIAELEARSAP
jgi:hypothetical protein